MSDDGYVSVTLPDARRLELKPEELPGEVTSLCRLLMRRTEGPAGERLMFVHIAELLGVSVSTLKAWRTPRPKRAKRSNVARSIPYTALYCLQTLALNPAAVARRVWS